MRWQTLGLGACFAMAMAVSLLLSQPVQAQDTPVAGVVVDAEGVLQKRSFADPRGRLFQQRAAAARASLGAEVADFSKMRKVSLNRLEAAIVARHGAPTDAMRYLAGLIRLRYVFFYPESGDIVIAGPAEGWATDASGRVMGLTSGRPTLQLQDLVVALRAFPPSGQGTRLIGCSIDPTQEGLVAMQNFLRRIGSYATPAQTQFIVRGLRDSLGPQVVSVNGVSPKTHFARVMVEADYRMKLIGIGLEKPPVQMVSFIDRANPAQVSRNALQRWYFIPDYECVRMSDDRLAAELVGDGVKLVGENEVVTGSGERQRASRESRASQAFVSSFTKNYPELAERSPVYAELRNLIDMTVAAALIQQEDYYGEAGWQVEFFGDEGAFSIETYNAPQHVGTAATARWKGNRLMTPVGGGVHIEPKVALHEDNLLSDDDAQVAELHRELQPQLEKGQWWWD